jgi:hypothetical protein
LHTQKKIFSTEANKGEAIAANLAVDLASKEGCKMGCFFLEGDSLLIILAIN